MNFNLVMSILWTILAIAAAFFGAVITCGIAILAAIIYAKADEILEKLDGNNIRQD